MAADRRSCIDGASFHRAHTASIRGGRLWLWGKRHADEDVAVHRVLLPELAELVVTGAEHPLILRGRTCVKAARPHRQPGLAACYDFRGGLAFAIVAEPQLAFEAAAPTAQGRLVFDSAAVKRFGSHLREVRLCNQRKRAPGRVGATVAEV